jgi:glycosyltransferase involved in cell wall biosynthesis
VYFTLAPTGAAFYRDCIFVAIMKLSGVTRIYHLHGNAARARQVRWLYRWAFRDAWVIHLSQRLGADLECFVPRERVLIVPNGVAERRTPARTERRGSARLLCLSNLTRSKGPLVLIDALGVLRARGIAFTATFAGAVHDGEFLAKCRAEIRRHGLEHQVFYIGPAYHDDKHRLFDEHDIFVLPTCNDAFPLAALEAMHAGIPVVTTRVGALPEILDDGHNGLLVPPGDPVALAGCLAALITDPCRGHRIGANGRARALQNYTQVRFEENLAAAIATCMEASSTRAEGDPP